MTAPTTAWQRIALDIVKKIRTGATPVGGKIASYRRLAEEYQTSIGTVKRAVEYLQEQGIVKGVQGTGLFVVSVPDEKPTFAPTSTEDPTDRIERAEDAISRLEEGQQDVRTKLGNIQAALRDLYARTGHRYPGSGRDDAGEPQKPRRRAASG